MQVKKSTQSAKNVRRTYTVDSGGIPVRVTRKKIKTMRIRILKYDHSVRLSIPFGVSDERAMLFLSSREAWIRETLARVSQHPMLESPDEELGDSFPLWGVTYPLKIEEAGRRYALLLPQEEGGSAIFRVPIGSGNRGRAEFLRSFRKKELCAVLDKLFPKWEEITGLVKSDYDIRDMKNRWGSCNTKTKHIRMNLRLTCYPMCCTEYVVLHELCHIAVPNHGKDFKALLDRYMPAWEEVQALLKGK